MERFIDELTRQCRIKMAPFERVFAEFEKEFPYSLQRSIAPDHFCWDCLSAHEYTDIIDSLFTYGHVSQMFTSFPSEKYPKKEVSVIKLSDYPMDYGFLTKRCFTGLRYLELSNQDNDKTQVSGLDHAEIFYGIPGKSRVEFNGSGLYNFFIEKGYEFKKIERTKYFLPVYETQDKETGFKLRFTSEFLINVIANKEIPFIVY